jgi:DnaJ like chaperone protein
MARAVMAHMALNDAQTRAAMHLFNAGKQPDFDLDGVLDQFRRECHGRRNLLQMFLEIQLQSMYADGRAHPAEERVLRHVCDRLGITRAEYKLLEMRLRAAWQAAGGAGAGPGPRRRGADDLKAAYAVLGIAPASSDETVKKTYRRLMNQHHPDKLVSKGLPEEMIKLATERTQEIKAAYETIKQARAPA